MTVPYIDLQFDGHVHTALCRHASGTMEEYVLVGISRNLHTLCFLEHLETEIIGYDRIWLTGQEFDRYIAEGERLKAQYKDEITVKIGVEVGFNPDCPDIIIHALGRHRWDRVGLSYHFLKIGQRHYNLVSRGQECLAAFTNFGVEQTIHAYLDGVISAITLLPGTVLCHLDAVLRHHDQVAFTTEHTKKITTILLLLKAKEMALEVNASGFPVRGEPFPGRVLLKEAAALGVRLVAGSDSHHPDSVGNFIELATWLKKL